MVAHVDLGALAHALARDAASAPAVRAEALLRIGRGGEAEAVAVLLDATVVRLVLVPALMTVLGDRNWYAPHWMGGGQPTGSAPP